MGIDFDCLYYRSGRGVKNFAVGVFLRAFLRAFPDPPLRVLVVEFKISESRIKNLEILVLKFKNS